MMNTEQPLYGLATYNPDLLSKQELIAGFVARQGLLDRLLAELRRETHGIPQHRLLVGHRGMGKTTLLRRLRFAIDDDPELGALWLPLVFPEEQYNIAALSDFWLNCVDSLGDALEQRGLEGPFRGLDETAARVQAIVDEHSRQVEALTLLLDVARNTGRRLLLLVDNMDQVLERIDVKAAWSLREVLSTQPTLMMLGAMTAAALEVGFQYDQPFHDFFKVHRLDSLDEPETFAVLRQLSTTWSAESVAQLLDRDPGRIKALRVLTGGNPRTVVLLFQVLARGAERGDVRSDLEQLLDQCTPLYKARFEALSLQAQRIVDAVAIHWDPVTAAQLAATLRMEANQISAQLDRLAKQGIIEKVEYYPGKRLAYSLMERFFNIWYLMRANRRVRRKLVWLVEFMRLLHAPRDLAQMARSQLCGVSTATQEWGWHRRGEYAFALADAVDEGSLRYALELEGIRCVLAEGETRTQLSAILDFDGDGQHLKSRAERLKYLKDAREILEAATDATWSGGAGKDFWPLLARSVSLSARQKWEVARDFSNISAQQRDESKQVLERERQEFGGRFGDLFDAVARAFEEGYMEVLGDIAGARAAAVVFDAPALVLVSLDSGGELPDDITFAELAEAAKSTRVPRLVVLAAKAALDRGAPPEDWDHLAPLVKTWMDGDLAAEDWNKLGNLLLIHLGRYPEAEDAYRKAIALALDERAACLWVNLGNLLTAHLGRYPEAEEAYRNAIALDERFAYPWNGLGHLLMAHLGRYPESEEAFRKAIALDERDASVWVNLGNLLMAHLGRYPEAEEAFRKAIALDERLAPPWIALGTLLAKRTGTYPEAEDAYRKAMELNPKSLIPPNGIAWAKFVRGTIDTETIALAHRLFAEGGRNPFYLHTAACVFTAADKWDIATTVIRQMLTAADPDFLEKCWPDIERLFQEIAHRGHAAEGRDLLDELGFADRWRPIREAMATVAEGTWRYLFTLAPEVRAPTKILLNRFQVVLADPTTDGR